MSRRPWRRGLREPQQSRAQSFSSSWSAVGQPLTKSRETLGSRLQTQCFIFASFSYQVFWRRPKNHVFGAFYTTVVRVGCHVYSPLVFKAFWCVKSTVFDVSFDFKVFAFAVSIVTVAQTWMTCKENSTI